MQVHDIGRSGWWQLVGSIPFIGWAGFLKNLMARTSMTDSDEI